MKNPYSEQKIRDILKVLNLTQSWLADRAFLSRQTVHFTLGYNDQDDMHRTRNRLLFTYILDDYIENETALTVDNIEAMIDHLHAIRAIRHP